MVCFKKKEKDLTVDFKWRFCTDLPCFILFVLWWIIVILSFIILQKSSDSNRLLYGRDYDGNTCGSNYIPSINTKKFIYYPKVNNDVHVKDYLKVNTNYLFGICVSECPQAKQVICTYDYNPIPSFSKVLECYNTHAIITNPICQHCWIVTMNTTAVLNRCIPLAISNTRKQSVCTIPSSEVEASDPRCLAKRTTIMEVHESSTFSSTVSSFIMNLSVLIGRWISDITAAYPLFIIAFGLAIGCGYFFLWIIRKCSRGMIWMTMLIGWLFCVFITVLIMNEAEIISLKTWIIQLINGGNEIFHWGSFTDEEIEENLPDLLPFLQLSTKTWRVLAWIAVIFDCLLFVIVLCLIKNITKSIAIMKESSRVIIQLPKLLLVPVISSICIGLIIFFCILSLVYSFSSSLSFHDYSSQFKQLLQPFLIQNSTLFCDDPQQQTNCTLLPSFIAPSSSMQSTLFIGSLFTCFWTIQFIGGIAIMTIAGTIGKWYFKRDGDTKESNSLCAAFCCTLSFHLGSVAFGSCLIAVTQLLRVIILYLEKKITSSIKEEKKGFVNRMFYCFRIGLMSIQKCLKFMNKNAYVLVINRGYSLTKASLRSFELYAFNLGIVSSLKTLYSFYISICMIVSCIVVVLICNILITFCPFLIVHEIIARIPILIVIVIITYCVMSCFVSVYTVTVDTILLCYCEEKQYGGLQTTVTDFAKQSIDSIDSIDNETTILVQSQDYIYN